MRNLDASLTRKEDSLNECVDEKNTVIERSNNLQRDMDSKIADLEKMKDANVSSFFTGPSLERFNGCNCTHRF